MIENRKNHWETVYATKQPHEVSWTQPVPKIALQWIDAAQLDKSASIIDVGGGDSRLVDALLTRGYENITVLDISEKALERAQKRLGEAAQKVQWLASDITEFKPQQNYVLWHDRATFHFLTDPTQVNTYQNSVRKAAPSYLILGTFSENGPKKCSGLEIQQYSETQMKQLWEKDFDKISCHTEDHTTPFDTQQNFLFCHFKRKENV